MNENVTSAMRPIGEITRWLSGGTPDRSNASYWRGEIPWISAFTLKTTEISTSDQFITKDAVASGSKMAPLDSTLLLVRGSALHKEIRAGLVVAPVAFNQDVKALIPTEAIVPKYLTFAIQGNADQLLRLVTSAGNTAGVLDTKVVQDFEIHVPERREQQKIIAALNDADSFVMTLERLITKKQSIMQGMMQQLLTGKTRLPGFTGQWKNHSLSDLAVIDPEGLPSGTNAGELIDYISLEDVSRGLLLKSTRTTFRDAPSRARRVIRSMDVLFGTVRPNLQSHALYRGGLPRPIASTGFAVIRAIAERSDPKFLLGLIMSDLATAQIERIIAGSNYPAVSSRDVRGLSFTVPDVQEQVAIGEALADFESEIGLLRVRLAKARAVKLGMMQQLLTGRAVLQPAEANA
ncbi:restriction endonuclease subunit S [Arthrobacter sp. CAL618]|uniref:restriction endonuclease subunit S n=1 Tax=Arthrobacter sp. CAL618 TaxID=1055770 RepID=UPI0004034115|nr:restriction endonuclease subunit S [Arthrobacter sp. CAL618]